jgi:phosphonate transport system permease protein
MSARLHAAFLADREGLARRHPEAIHPGWRRYVRLLAGVVAALGLYVFGLVWMNAAPLRLLHGLSELASVARLMWPPYVTDGAKITLYLGALGQTLAIAFLGTLMAAVLALPAGFLAARNVVANRVLRILARRSLDIVRSIDTLIWALVWINVVGLGPFAGALAIMTTDFAALAKLMSEAIETADRKPIDGVTATGAGRLAVIRFGIMPQIMPIFASQLLYFFESNTRSATIIGIVGAGGVGLWLSEAIRVLEWRDVSFIILLVLVAVAAIDLVSRRLRAAIMGARAR